MVDETRRGAHHLYVAPARAFYFGAEVGRSAGRFAADGARPSESCSVCGSEGIGAAVTAPAVLDDPGLVLPSTPKRMSALSASAPKWHDGPRSAAHWRASCRRMHAARIAAPAAGLRGVSLPRTFPP
ncbi:MAG: hypothetical protein OXC31_09910, partial [Spirochaetaceae bacterium]|nr:hypothetical protein [Spirochaetaceae bacterium]